MFPILFKDDLSDVVKLFKVDAPLIARKAKPGQYVIVIKDKKGERIPLTIADFNSDEGTITLVLQTLGKSTKQIGLMEIADEFDGVAGPLGNPTEIENFGTVVMVAGGVGVAPIFPITRALKEAGNHVISIIGARNKSLLFWEDRIAKYSDELIICTDDGSYGRKGVVTQPLKEILQKREDIERVWAIGPAIMMKFVAETTRPFYTPTIVSLNTIMIDGTGMCGGCRVNIGDTARFVCVDGPEFDAHQVDWDNLLARLSFYKEEEREALEHWEEHDCKLDQALLEGMEVVNIEEKIYPEYFMYPTL